VQSSYCIKDQEYAEIRLLLAKMVMSRGGV
jgi:hypothetical protein